MAYATETLHGAAAALAPMAVQMGQVAGYTVADYLLQHAGAERRMVKVPASTWKALLTYLTDPTDQHRAADNAMNRLLYSYAEPLYRKAADAGDFSAAPPPGGWLTCWLGRAGSKRRIKYASSAYP